MLNNHQFSHVSQVFWGLCGVSPLDVSFEYSHVLAEKCE